jgi:hypothetical protein
MAASHTDDFRREAVRIALTSGLKRRQVVECTPELRQKKWRTTIKFHSVISRMCCFECFCSYSSGVR